jgi:hypothetical protein
MNLKNRWSKSRTLDGKVSLVPKSELESDDPADDNDDEPEEGV